MSDGLLNILDELKKARVQAVKITLGAPYPERIGLNRLTDAGLKDIFDQIRRDMFLSAMRAHARLLLDRKKGLVGEGTQEAAKMRAGADTTH